MVIPRVRTTFSIDDVRLQLTGSRVESFPWFGSPLATVEGSGSCTDLLLLLSSSSSHFLVLLGFLNPGALSAAVETSRFSSFSSPAGLRN